MELTKNASNMILAKIASYQDLSYSIKQALSIISQNYSTKSTIYKVLTRILTDEAENSMPIDYAMEKRGLIDNIERLILHSNTDKKMAIVNILEQRNDSNKYEKTIQSLFVFPYLLLLLSTIAVTIIQPKIIAFIEKINIEQNITIDLTNFWFLQTQFSLLFFMFIVTAILSIIYASYRYGLNYNYKYLFANPLTKLKAYEEIPRLLFIIYSIKQGGVNLNNTLILINKEQVQKSIIRLNQLMMSYTNQFQVPISKALSEIDTPNEITTLIEASEINSTLWDNVHKYIHFFKQQSKTYNQYVSTYLKPITTILAWCIPLYFVVNFFLLIQEIMTSIINKL